MGFDMNTIVNVTKKEFYCETHGGYLKFESELNKNCPYCEQQAAKKAIANQVKKLDFGFIDLVEVPISCLKHGDQIVKVPDVISKHAKCPGCRTDALTEQLKIKMGDRVKQECKKAELPANSFGTFSQLSKTVKSEKQTRIYDRFKQYVLSMFESKTTEGHQNIYLTGNMGTGKTSMASILMQNIILRSVKCDSLDPSDIKFNSTYKCLFITEAKLNTEIYATWRKNSESTYKSLMSKLIKVPFLCIDDVGSVSQSEHLFEAYMMIIDERYKRRLPTVITSNVPFDQLQEIIGAREKDRFAEKNQIIVVNCDWEGYRTAQANEIEFF